MSRCAFVTLVNSPDYVIGATALKRSLDRVASAHPLVCMVVAGSCDSASLERAGCLVREVRPPKFSDEFTSRHGREALHQRAPFDKGEKPAFHNPLNNFCKLALWRLTEYDKVVFLDADILLLRNIDHLMDYPEFCAAPNLYEGLDGFHRMNSGSFTAVPSETTYQNMLAVLDRPGVFWRRTDQTFLQAFFSQWHGLPYIYNALQYLYLNLPQLWQWSNIHVIHYQYEKPWQKSHPKARQLKPLIDLWWAVYEGRDIDAQLVTLAQAQQMQPNGGVP
ncbi:glycosyltransferase family 8 protein [Microbulbifer sp. GL-2]|uniref:glycosyltransferase n=1 Tax=Microbulbifer sp. GL-2 TaxID=2591606 RepID=UPI001163DEDF|nr:glycosyltransferase family 8 protein [Microbulbifer sp. GL-2]BBM03984.1 glycosyl transferase [Microbulbifer sp. GL-2]